MSSVSSSSSSLSEKGEDDEDEVDTSDDDNESQKASEADDDDQPALQAPAQASLQAPVASPVQAPVAVVAPSASEGRRTESPVVKPSNVLFRTVFNASDQIVGVEYTQTDRTGEVQRVLTSRLQPKRELDELPSKPEVLWGVIDVLAKRLKTAERALEEHALLHHRLTAVQTLNPTTFPTLGGTFGLGQGRALPLAPPRASLAPPASQTAPAPPRAPLAPSRAPPAPAPAPAPPPPPQPAPEPIGTISEEVLKQIEDNFELHIRHDLHDVNGNAFVGGGDSGGTLCGAFPHVLLPIKKGNGELKAIVSGDKSVVVHVSLRRKNMNGKIDRSLTESTVLEMLRNAHSPEDRAKMGFFHRNIVCFLELVLHDESDCMAESTQICAVDGDDDDDDDAEMCTFTHAPPGGHLLVPQESAAYSNGAYEKALEGGSATFKFHLNKQVYTSNLTSALKGSNFCFRVRCLNPYLAKLSGFTVASMPFETNASTGRRVNAGEWYVEGADGKPKLVPKTSVPIRAPMPRRG